MSMLVSYLRIIAFVLLRLSGQGLMTHSAVTAVSRYFGARRGRALSLTAMGFPLAEASLPALAIVMIAWLGWQASYAAIGAFVLLAAAPVLVWLVRSRPDFARPPSIERKSGVSTMREGFRILVRSRFIWLALPLILYMPFVSTALVFHIQGIGSGLVQTTLGALWAETFGAERLGAIRSFAVMMMVAGTAAGPAVLGMLFDPGIGIGAISPGLIGCGIAFALLAAAAVAHEMHRQQA